MDKRLLLAFIADRMKELGVAEYGIQPAHVKNSWNTTIAKDLFFYDFGDAFAYLNNGRLADLKADQYGRK